MNAGSRFESGMCNLKVFESEYVTMKIIRVFPGKTKLTPDDANVVVNRAPMLFDEADEIHVSVLFKHDVSLGHYLARQWEKVAPVKLGGVAFDEPGGDFVPGLYVKRGAVITSRGCNNRCWFCSVWRREGQVRELPITEGWNVLDDNLLSCSEKHVRKVFEMLDVQKRLGNRPQFSGGFEARLLKDWHVDLLSKLKPRRMFFAYDSSDDLDPLVVASCKLREAGFACLQLPTADFLLFPAPCSLYSLSTSRSALRSTPSALRVTR